MMAGASREQPARATGSVAASSRDGKRGNGLRSSPMVRPRKRWPKPHQDQSSVLKFAKG